jgi:hypothetical protein
MAANCIELQNAASLTEFEHATRWRVDGRVDVSHRCRLRMMLVGCMVGAGCCAGHRRCPSHESQGAADPAR